MVFLPTTPQHYPVYNKPMVNIVQYNHLEVIKKVDFGLYLDGGDYGNILLPKSMYPNIRPIAQHLMYLFILIPKTALWRPP